MKLSGYWRLLGQNARRHHSAGNNLPTLGGNSKMISSEGASYLGEIINGMKILFSKNHFSILTKHEYGI